MTDVDRAHPAPSWWMINLAGAAWALVCAGIFVAGGPVWDAVGQHAELHGVYLAKYEAAARALRELKLPLWNPYDFAGIPLLGTAHGAMLYPPVPISFSLLAPRNALQALYVGHAALLAWACTAYVARIGLSAWLGGLAAVVALAGLMSGLAGVGIDHPPILMCLAWVPVELLCWEEALRGRSLRWLAGLALAVAGQWLAGYPQFLPDTAVLLGVVALVGSRGAPRLPTRVAVLAAGFALGTALAAVYVLPVVEVGEQSMRSGAPEAVMSQRAGFRVDSLRDLAVLTPYDARLAPVFAVALLSLAGVDRRRLAWLIAFVWSVFPVNFPFSLLYEVPPLRLVRNPFEWAYLSALFLGFLATAGAATLYADRRRALRITGVVATIAVLLPAAWVAVQRDPSIMRHGCAPPYALLGKRAATLHALGRTLHTDARFLSRDELVWSSTLRHRLRSIAGFEPALRPRRIDRLLRELDIEHTRLIYGLGNRWRGVVRQPDLAGLLGIGFVVTPRRYVRKFTEAGFAEVATLEPNDVVMFRRPMPRVRVVHDARRVATDEEALALLFADPESSRTAPVIEEQFGPLRLEKPPAQTIEPAFTIVDEPDHVEIDVTLATPGLLLLMENWFPGWEVEVDGRPAPLLRVDYTFRGVALDAGRHVVAFRYRPLSVRIGTALSATALVLVAVLVLAGGRGPWGRRAATAS